MSEEKMRAEHEYDSAAVRMDKQRREDVAAALGFIRGGNYAWSYLLQQIKDITSAVEAPQPAEQHLKVLAKGYFHPLDDENDYEFHAEENFPDGNDCPDCVPAVIVRKSAVVIHPAPYVEDYEQVLEDQMRLTRELDVLLNGEEGAAQQASLADLVAQLRTVVRNTGKPILAAPDVSELVK